MKIRFNQNNPSPFVIPKGFYRARLLHVKSPPENKGSCPIEDQVVFQFELEPPLDWQGPEPLLAKAQRCACKKCNSFPDRSSSRFLERWLGDDVHEIIDRDGNADLSLLRNVEADVEITHYQGPGYSQPYTILKWAYTPGTKVKYE